MNVIPWLAGGVASQILSFFAAKGSMNKGSTAWLVAGWVALVLAFMVWAYLLTKLMVAAGVVSKGGVVSEAIDFLDNTVGAVFDWLPRVEVG